MDWDWAEAKINELAAATEDVIAAGNDYSGHPVARRRTLQKTRRRVMVALPAAERVLEFLDPNLFATLRSAPDLTAVNDVAQRARSLIEQRTEIEEKIGPTGPQLAADRLHQYVWESAASLWDLGHFPEAVEAAAKAVNAMLQEKVNRRDVGEVALVRSAFGTDLPSTENPRLRFPDVDKATEPKDWENRHGGARNFGVGCFMGIRNVLSHARPEDEVGDEKALEYLAAFSMLARWIDETERRTDGD